MTTLNEEAKEALYNIATLLGHSSFAKDKDGDLYCLQCSAFIWVTRSSGIQEISCAVVEPCGQAFSIFISPYYPLFNELTYQINEEYGLNLLMR